MDVSISENVNMKQFVIRMNTRTVMQPAPVARELSEEYPRDAGWN